MRLAGLLVILFLVGCSKQPTLQGNGGPQPQPDSIPAPTIHHPASGNNEYYNTERAARIAALDSALHTEFGVPLEWPFSISEIFDAQNSMFQVVDFNINEHLHNLQKRIPTISDSALYLKLNIDFHYDTLSNGTIRHWINVADTAFLYKDSITNVSRDYFFHSWYIVGIGDIRLLSSPTKRYCVVHLPSQYGLMSAQMQCAHNELVLFDITDMNQIKLDTIYDTWYSNVGLINDFNGDGVIDLLTVDLNQPWAETPHYPPLEWYVHPNKQRRIARLCDSIAQNDVDADFLGLHYVLACLYTIGQSGFSPVVSENGQQVYWAGYSIKGLAGPAYWVQWNGLPD